MPTRLPLRQNSTFIILLFFLLTFSLARGAVYLYQFNIFPVYPFANLFGTHVHHFVFGIGLLITVGFLTLTLPAPLVTHWRLRLSAIYGIGLGWTIDEFGMWLQLADNYYMRASYDAIICVSIILLNFIFFRKIWVRLFYRLFRRTFQLLSS